MFLRLRILNIFLLIISVSFFTYVDTLASVIFSTESNGTHDPVFYIDSGDTAEDFVDLEFGQSIDAKLRYDIANDKFEINRDTNFRGNEIQNFMIENLAVAPTCDASNEGRLYFNTVDKLTYSCDGVSTWNPLENALNVTIEFPVVQARRTTTYTLTTSYADITFDVTDLENDVATLDHDNVVTDRINIGATAMYQIIYGYTSGGTAAATHEARARVRVNDTTVLSGSESVNRNYQQEFSTTSASFLANLTDGDFISLQLQRDATVDATQDDIYFSIIKLEGIRGEKGDEGDPGDASGTTSNVFTLDNDDTGGDVILQFGTTLAESLRWDNANSHFVLSDGLSLEGNELVDFRIENLAVAPACDGTRIGRIYYNTVDKKTYTCNGTDWVTRKKIKNYTGRAYLYSDNRWTTWSNNSYGPNYYQWASNCGTGVNPNCSWAGLGSWVPKGTIITKIEVIGRANNTEVTDVEQVWQFRHPNPITRWETGLDNNSEDISIDIYRNFWWNNTTPGQPAFTGNTNDIHRRQYEVNYVTPEDGWIDQVVRPVGTLSANRYFYGATNLEYILPEN